MRYRRLGHSEIDLSVISFGTWKYREGETDKRRLKNLMCQSFERGVNHVDTAITYDNGHAEQFIGSLWESVARDRIILGTKCYFPTGQGPGDRGLSQKHLLKCINASLKYLKTDYVDLFQCHRWDADTPVEETIETMDLLLKQGKIRYWGLGAASGAQLVEATLKSEIRGWAKPVSHQHVYNMFNRTAEFDVLQTGNSFGLGFLAYSPLAQGVLSGKYSNAVPTGSRASIQADASTMWDLTPEKIAKAGELAEFAKNMNVSAASLALAWCLRKPQVTTVITSASDENQLHQNLSAAEIDLSEQVQNELEHILDNKPYNIYTQK